MDPSTPASESSGTIDTELLRLRNGVRHLPFDGSGMYNATAFIKGAGFFPAAWGSLDPAVPVSERRVMVLGQDQDNTSGLVMSLKKHNETYSSTWRNMKPLLEDAGIALSDCFFTNFIPGIREDGTRNTGPSPALRHPEFMRACAMLFVEQLTVQKPDVILCLGMIPFQLLSLVSEALRYRSIAFETFKDLEKRNMLVLPDVIFDALPESSFVVVPICHPSYPQNGAKRFVPNVSPYANEVKLLRHVKQEYLK